MEPPYSVLRDRRYHKKTGRLSGAPFLFLAETLILCGYRSGKGAKLLDRERFRTGCRVNPDGLQKLRAAIAPERGPQHFTTLRECGGGNLFQ